MLKLRSALVIACSSPLVYTHLCMYICVCLWSLVSCGAVQSDCTLIFWLFMLSCYRVWLCSFVLILYLGLVSTCSNLFNLNTWTVWCFVVHTGLYKCGLVASWLRCQVCSHAYTFVHLLAWSGFGFLLHENLKSTILWCFYIAPELNPAYGWPCAHLSL